MFNITQVFLILILLSVANGTPVILARILGNNLAQPLDGGCKFFDGQPVFGSSKTIRGVASALLATTLVSPLIGISPFIGLVLASLSMVGDLLSSFIKRRLNLIPSSKATGIDQIPEALIPALGGMQLLELHLLDVFTIVILFFLGEKVFSKILFKFKIRKRPY